MLKEIRTLNDLNYGAAEEQFSRAFDQIISNMMDPATNATDKRSITITVDFLPSEDRQTAQVHIKAKTALAPIKTDSGSLVLDYNDQGLIVGKTYEQEDQGELFLEKKVEQKKEAR